MASRASDLDGGRRRAVLGGEVRAPSSEELLCAARALKSGVGGAPRRRQVLLRQRCRTGEVLCAVAWQRPRAGRSEDRNRRLAGAVSGGDPCSEDIASALVDGGMLDAPPTPERPGQI